MKGWCWMGLHARGLAKLPALRRPKAAAFFLRSRMSMPAALASFVSWIGVGLPAFLFVITLVVFIHELGHFVVARLCGVGVDTFSIGFGREIIGFTDRKG